MAEDEEKTEDPTPRRREESRKKGQVARSQDLNTAVLILAGMGLIYFFGGGIRNSFARMMIWAFGGLHTIDLSQPGIEKLFRALIGEVMAMVAPFAIGMMFFGLAVSVIQVGFFISAEAMVPKFSKLDPIKGVKNLISMASIVKVLMSLIKLFIIGSITYWVVIADLQLLFGLSSYDIGSIFAITSDIVFWMVIKMALAMLLLALIDWMYQIYRHEQQLKMSRQEIKEEMKQTEGDPQIKGRIRQKMMQASYRRMMQDVPEADVVVTNPTHIAVALKYDQEVSEAPIVLAKGQRLIAQRIKQIALENGVPIMEDKPLARAIFQSVEIGEEVPPPALYRAVAKVIGYIYRLKRKKLAGAR